MSDSDLVFPSPASAPQAADRLLRGRFRSLLKRAVLPSHFTLYFLRSTFAALQYLAGERDRVISDLMWHERVRTVWKDCFRRVWLRAFATHKWPRRPYLTEAERRDLERPEGLRNAELERAMREPPRDG